MAGTWEVVSVEVDGEALGAGQDVTTVVVEKDRLVVKGATRRTPRPSRTTRQAITRPCHHPDDDESRGGTPSVRGLAASATPG